MSTRPSRSGCNPGPWRGYHPVEKEAFETNGAPVLDISDDVHEFLELRNAGAVPVDLAGWRLFGGIEFDFSADPTIAAGDSSSSRKNLARLAAIPQYGLLVGAEVKASRQRCPPSLNKCSRSALPTRGCRPQCF